MFSVKKFKILLADSGMTIEEYSKVCGVRQCSISQILNHGVEPKLTTIGKLAKGLGVSAAALMED